MYIELPTFIGRKLWDLVTRFGERELLPMRLFYVRLNDFSDSLDSRDFKGSSDDEEENRLCNTVLITGPTGVGKTAAVYACAQELGFKVSISSSGWILM